jgi:hypothetical protein
MLNWVEENIEPEILSCLDRFSERMRLDLLYLTKFKFYIRVVHKIFDLFLSVFFSDKLNKTECRADFSIVTGRR